MKPTKKATVAVTVLCIHCGVRKALPGKRGLCYSHYYKPSIRAMYPMADSPYNRRGFGLGGHDRPLAAEPTTAPAGSPEKLAVLEHRAENGLELWHPLDAQRY